MRMCHFRAQNGPFVMNKIFLVQTIYLLALFIVLNLNKFLQRIQSYEDAPFLGPKWSICPKFFFGKLLVSFSSTYQPLSLGKIFQKFFQRIQSYEDAQFLGPKWLIFPNDIYIYFFFSENLLMSLVSFIHAYLHAKNQSQILIYQ